MTIKHTVSKRIKAEHRETVYKVQHQQRKRVSRLLCPEAEAWKENLFCVQNKGQIVNLVVSY